LGPGFGRPQRFPKASEIWAFAGFDIVTEQSGDFRRIGHITKKGDPAFRDTLYLIGFNMANNIPALARTKQKALARGKGQVAATIHTARKANRICHHLLFHQLPFHSDRLR
jgi:transposase